ncbi:uncharacterized protein F4822DRAFT_435435 [Hypoxylon trugodes]|uniref:uncharacterized protein n=1 Tax=Hypoxylon trugodes TaxID=326681 RepID=UPI0021938BE6|nr:uncharacterized protein F4822DRAFT_435435 [Hypoxylon trugodes]KAI1382585.1 hypothetical protein F4822DRAFT_435435 [Hypoxylon trugodes]
MSNSENTTKLHQLPYWQVNVSPDQRTEQCPDFLRDISDKDQRILSTWDNDYRRDSWEQVKEIVARNDLASFRRVPSDLRRYLEFKFKVQKEYGSILNYVRQKRLKWQSDTPSGEPPFSNPTDYTILWNDWPYGISTDITHLVVWTKFVLETESITDDILSSTRAVIENFVVKVFCDNGGPERSKVIWFKNWSSLKSIDGIEHFHVMLYKADGDFIGRVTCDDHPLCVSS